MQHIEFRAMGCQMLAVLDTATPTLLQQVPAWFEAWENVFSRFRNDSELSRLNTHAGAFFSVSEPLWQVIQQALSAAQISGGLVTPTVLDALIEAGYACSFEQLPAQQVLSSKTARVLNWQDIECNEHQRSVRLPRGTRLDLSGFAKGWCADQAVRRLSVHAPALMDAGGDIAVSGAMADGGGWCVAIADPFAPDLDLHQITLHSGGVATSGRDYRQWQVGERVHHHIIDPRTAQPAHTDVMSATVIAASASAAEMAAKVLLILGAQAGMAWLDAREDFAACVVTELRECLMSASFDQYLDKG